MRSMEDRGIEFVFWLILFLVFLLSYYYLCFTTVTKSLRKMSVYVFKRKNSCTAKINVIFILCRLIVTDQPNSNQRK